MATIQALSMSFTKGNTTSAPKMIRRNGNVTPVSLPSIRNICFIKELEKNAIYKRNIANKTIRIRNDPMSRSSATFPDHDDDQSVVTAKLYAIMEAVADRVEMHKNIGEQRNNWNQLMLTSINGITLAAATMVGLAAAVSASTVGPATAFKATSTLLYLGATFMSVIMNMIQPSQLAEEQRNAARLFKQLHGQIRETLALRGATTTTTTDVDVNEALEKVLALDRAYPLPLLGAMLDKFPSVVEPAVWWPKREYNTRRRVATRRPNYKNGWSEKLEDEMKEIGHVLQKKDRVEYLRLSENALKLNKTLAILGPLLTSIAALGSVFVGRGSYWATIAGMIGGGLASLVNTVQHGGQVGMVFEMYRSNAGFFTLMYETIERNVNESDVMRRENGEVVKLKVGLQLGRSLSELNQLVASSSRNDEEFASKLF